MLSLEIFSVPWQTQINHHTEYIAPAFLAFHHLPVKFPHLPSTSRKCKWNTGEEVRSINLAVGRLWYLYIYIYTYYTSAGRIRLLKSTRTTGLHATSLLRKRHQTRPRYLSAFFLGPPQSSVPCAARHGHLGGRVIGTNPEEPRE